MYVICISPYIFCFLSYGYNGNYHVDTVNLQNDIYHSIDIYVVVIKILSL